MLVAPRAGVMISVHQAFDNREVALPWSPPSSADRVALRAMCTRAGSFFGAPDIVVDAAGMDLHQPDARSQR